MTREKWEILIVHDIEITNQCSLVQAQSIFIVNRKLVDECWTAEISHTYAANLILSK